MDAFGGSGGSTGSAGVGSDGGLGASTVSPHCNFGGAVVNEGP